MADLVGEPGAQESREIAGRRRVESGLDDRRIVEPRPPEVLESLRVEGERACGLGGWRRGPRRVARGRIHGFGRGHSLSRISGREAGRHPW
ncbi:MAG: hypothetical protein AABZ70_13445, partial [candidate division NC10 bacterium]